MLSNAIPGNGIDGCKQSANTQASRNGKGVGTEP
jgi:hypothetical protein